MDLYNHENNKIRMLGQMRSEAATAHNERITARRQEAARDILSAKDGEQDEVASENTEEMAKGGAASISTAIDANSARKAIKDTIKDRAEKAIKNKVKSSINSVAEKVDKPHDVPHDTRTMNPLADTHAENEKMVERASKVALKDKINNKMEAGLATKVGKAGLKSAGSFMNVGMGLEALHDDFKGGQFHLAGKNGLEEASNALQIGSAVADIAGVYITPLLAVGMLLGAASSVTGAVGQVQETEAIEAKQKQKTSDFISKTKASLSGLHMIDPDKARASANPTYKPQQTRITQKAAG